MLNPVLSRCLGSTIASLVLLAGQSSCAVAQDRIGDQGDVSGAWPSASRGIRAEGSMGTRLEIIMIQGSETRVRAVLTQGGSQWVATSGECETLASAIDAFRRLPPVRPGPQSLQPPMPDGVVVPPRKADGESWTIQTAAYAPDWSSNEITLRGLGGPYPFWVDDTVEAIKRCGPPPP